jgi:hypothetical protein
VEPEINDAFQLQASTARIVRIKISCLSSGDTYSVRSSTCFLEIENCELVSATDGCVRVEESALFKATESMFKSKMHPATNLSKTVDQRLLVLGLMTFPKTKDVAQLKLILKQLVFSLIVIRLIQE